MKRENANLFRPPRKRARRRCTRKFLLRNVPLSEFSLSILWCAAYAIYKRSALCPWCAKGTQSICGAPLIRRKTKVLWDAHAWKSASRQFLRGQKTRGRVVRKQFGSIYLCFLLFVQMQCEHMNITPKVSVTFVRPIHFLHVCSFGYFRLSQQWQIFPKIRIMTLYDLSGLKNNSNQKLKFKPKATKLTPIVQFDIIKKKSMTSK